MYLNVFIYFKSIYLTLSVVIHTHAKPLIIHKMAL